MIEDRKNHDPKPSDAERRWMDTNPFSALLRVLALAGVAVAIGLAAAPPAPSAHTTIAAAAHR